MKQIISNSVKCLKCNEIIFSTHVHDFVTCSCGNISVDGGCDYLRRLSNDFDNVQELSLHMELDHIQKIKEAVKWGKNNNKNDLGIALSVVRELRDLGLLNMEKFQ